MNDAADAQPLPPELDADRSTEVRDAAPIPERERMQLTGVAAELAALSNRTENASAEVAAIEMRMQGLVEELTTMAGVTSNDAAPPKPADPA